MKIDMKLELKDVPGTLIKVIEPISQHGGNIRSVLHLRTGMDLVPVEILFEVPDEFQKARATVAVDRKAVGCSYKLEDGRMKITLAKEHVISKNQTLTVAIHRRSE